MGFGERIRQLREKRGLTQKALAARLGISASYVNKVENERLSTGDYPSERFIHRFAAELDADEDELLLLADKVPAAIRECIRLEPEVFRRLASLDRETLRELASQLEPR